MFAVKCRKCNLVAEAGGLCKICIPKKECRSCKRRLGDDLFRVQHGGICITCHKKLSKRGLRQTCIGDTLVQVDLPIDSDETADLESLIHTHTSAIQDVIADA